MKFTHGLTRHINAYISQQDLLIYMQPEPDNPITEEDDNVLRNFRSHKDKKSISEKQDIERDYRNLVSESSDTRSHPKDALSERTPQAGYLKISCHHL